VYVCVCTRPTNRSKNSTRSIIYLYSSLSNSLSLTFSVALLVKLIFLHLFHFLLCLFITNTEQRSQFIGWYVLQKNKCVYVCVYWCVKEEIKRRCKNPCRKKLPSAFDTLLKKPNPRYYVFPVIPSYSHENTHKKNNKNRIGPQL